LVTASSDGKVNYWSVSNLRDPVETVIVDANLSCLDVLHYGSNEGVVCGDERGGMHVILASSGRDGGSGSGASKRVVRTFHPGGVFGDTSLDASLEGGDAAANDNESGHYGMVTAVAARPAIVNNGNTRSSMKESTSSMAVGGMSKGFLRGAGGLLITTGVDWSTKLWAPGYSDAPLMSFLSNSYDYMCDVQWSPVHPSIFATASSNGTVNIWNLATSLDQPISGTEGISIDNFSNNSTDPTSVAAAASRQGLNRLKWSADGRRMAVASGDKMHVLSVGDDVWKSKGDEEGSVMNNLLSRGLIHE
jgi:dynein intermediate chain